MTDATLHAKLAHVPGFIRLPGPIVRRLLRSGLPIGPNARLTVKGRKTGEPRSIPLAVMQLDGRRWVNGTFGDVNWCRNMRANPDVEFQRGSRPETLIARELPADEAADFFRDLLPPAEHGMRPFSRFAAWMFIR